MQLIDRRWVPAVADEARRELMELATEGLPQRRRQGSWSLLAESLTKSVIRNILSFFLAWQMTVIRSLETETGSKILQYTRESSLVCIVPL